MFYVLHDIGGTMNQSQLLGLLRRYIKESWSREQRLLSRQSPDYLARKAEHDGALKALTLLDAAAWQQQQAKQPTLGGEA